MKIQKQISDKRNNKIYYKNVVVLPKELLKKSGLKESDKLKGKAEKNKIVIKKSNK